MGSSFASEQSISIESSDSQTVKWELVHCLGQIPSSRCGQSVVVYHRKAYLFGGYGGNGETPTHLSDFYCYHFDSGVWEVLGTSENCPSPRTSTAMCATPDGFICIWGGTGHDLQGFEEHDLHKYDIVHNKWTNISSTGYSGLNSRCFGRTCNYRSNTLYFFGGGMKGGVFTNELIVYDLQNNNWSKIETTGEIPSPRYKHQSCIVGNTLLVIGGGCHLPTAETVDMYALCLLTFKWKYIETFGALPVGRVAHTCEFDAVSNCIYLWGGFDATMASLSDFYKLDLSTGEWSALAIPENLDFQRRFHSSCFFEGGLYSFNGSDGETRFADLMCFQIYHTPPSLLRLCSESCSLTSQVLTDAFKLPEELRTQVISEYIQIP